MLHNKHFYNRTIRKIVVAFGTMFNDIQVARFDKNGDYKEIFKVPLNYGAKEKYITRINSDPTLTKSVATTVPRMSFELTSMNYDSARKQVTTGMNFSTGTAGINTQYNPVPYNFDFTLSIYVRNTEDGTQILEQILPFFTPDYTVTINFNPDMGKKYDMPIILNDVSNEVDYEGDFMNTRLIIWTLTFTAKAYIFPMIKYNANGVIHTANTNITPTTANGNVAVTLTTTPNPSSAQPDDMFGFAEVINENVSTQ